MRILVTGAAGFIGSGLEEQINDIRYNSEPISNSGHILYKKSST